MRTTETRKTSGRACVDPFCLPEGVLFDIIGQQNTEVKDVTDSCGGQWGRDTYYAARP